MMFILGVYIGGAIVTYVFSMLLAWISKEDEKPLNYRDRVMMTIGWPIVLPFVYLKLRRNENGDY